VLDRGERGIALDHDDVDLEPDQLGREDRVAFGPTLGIPQLKGEASAFRVAELSQPSPKGFEAALEARAPTANTPTRTTFGACSA
jgi:hypothetical protein